MNDSSSFRVTKHLTREEIVRFTQQNNMKALRALSGNYLLIFACFLAAALYPYWFVYLTVIAVLASRQLGLAVLMHECAHNSLFAQKSLNQWVGKWLCGAPILIELEGYRRYHLKHHQLAGTDQDPDYPNYRDYPVSKASMRRKLLRDITGITGIKNLTGLLMMYGEANSFDLSYKPKQETKKIRPSIMLKNILRNMFPYILVHCALIACLILLGVGELYYLWLVTFLTAFSVLLRIRNAAEHAAVPNLLNADPRVHTRTTLPKWWQGFFLAPYGVNYHIEHHLLPSVPAYNLGAFHTFLAQKDVLKNAEIAHGYDELFRKLVHL